MDSHRRTFSPSFLSHHLLNFLFIASLIFLNCCSASKEVSVITSSSDDQNENQKVTLALYYETLCPYCSNLIVNYLPELFEGDLLSIVDFKLIPYGNAKIRSNGTIVCQHGPTECLLNTIEACAIHVWPELNEYFPFVYCVEALIYEGKSKEWESCYAKLGLDPKPVSDCYSSGLGNELELQYAAVTNDLQPSHTYVPWVVVDGQPLYDDYRYFVSFICKAYKGTNVPKACLETISKKKANPIRLFRYIEASPK